MQNQLSMNERNSIIARLLITHLFPVPAMIAGSLFFPEYYPIILIIAQTLLFILFLAGYREFFGKFFWTSYFISIQIILISTLILMFGEHLFTYNKLIFMLLFFVELYLLFMLYKILKVIFGKEKENFEIAFPLQNGKYLVTDGGNSRISRLMNYHFHSKTHKKRGTNCSMLFATDIVKTENQKHQFLPPRNEDYSIFGENLYCPMDGVVEKTVNDIDDNEPFSGNYPYNTGNTVVIKSGSYFFLVGHLKKGSIRVKEGDTVVQNDLLAQCGNSGMSERPHLHMQLMKCQDDNYWKGTGVNITFQGKNLFKNRQIEIKQK